MERLRPSDQRGFTLIELLVVVLIIGILAAIGIPMLLDQRSKANDTAAKRSARSAQVAMEAFYTEGNTYLGATLSELQQIEPTLRDDPVPTLDLNAEAKTYTITSVADKTDNEFSISRAADGSVSRTCVVGAADRGGCKTGDVW